MNRMRFLPLALALGSLFIPNRLMSQVQRYNATADNDYGVLYTLPKTEYVCTVKVLHERFTPGELALWSEKYLSKSSELKERDTYKIVGVHLGVSAVADTTKRYIVTFDKKTIAPFIKLLPNGVIFSINGDEPQQDTRNQDAKLEVPQDDDRQTPALAREYSLATTKAKRAEIAANYLYELRELGMNLVSGEVDQMPKDGESMRLILDKIRTEEKRTLSLFEGYRTYRIETHTFRIVPELEDMNARTLFNFSPQWGVVPADDLSGDPVRYDLKIIERSPELSPKELAKRDKLDGIVYNVPGVAEMRIYTEGRDILKQRLPITQVGTIQSLSKKMFNIKEAGATAVYFDPNSGALLRVTTE